MYLWVYYALFEETMVSRECELVCVNMLEIKSLLFRLNLPPPHCAEFYNPYRTYTSTSYRTYVQAKDITRARAVYKAAINIIPNKIFTFGKVWILAAQLEVRQKDLAAARKILGMAIGM